jgi:hypothetical protein
MNRQADGVDIFLKGGTDDLFRRIVNAKVDDFYPCVSQRPRNDLYAPVMAIQASLRNQYA